MIAEHGEIAPLCLFRAERALPIEQIVTLYEAARLLVDAAYGLHAQPRFHDEGGTANAAGEAIEIAIDALNDDACALAERLRLAVPRTPAEAERRALTLISHECWAGNSPAEIAALAASLAAGRHH